MTYRRRTPPPLPMPAFGAPADGRQCMTCKRWFHRDHFWRKNLDAHVERCADCIAKTLPHANPNTRNTGKKKPFSKVVVYGNNDLTAVLRSGKHAGLLRGS